MTLAHILRTQHGDSRSLKHNGSGGSAAIRWLLRDWTAGAVRDYVAMGDWHSPYVKYIIPDLHLSVRFSAFLFSLGRNPFGYLAHCTVNRL